MFAIDHAATALFIKRRFPEQSIVPLLCVCAAHGTFLGCSESVRHRADDNRNYRSFSFGYPPILYTVFSFHSDESRSCSHRMDSGSVVFHRPKLGIALAFGIVSHLVLDLLTHAPDIAIAPGFESTKLGLGLYSAFPIGAFVLGLLYGFICWWVYKGGKALLAVILLFNVANLSLLSPAVPGPESLLANRPTAIVLVIFAQIIVTLVLVGFYSMRPSHKSA